MIDDILAFADAKGLTLSRLSDLATGDPSLVSELIGGGFVTRSAQVRLRRFMADNAETVFARPARVADAVKAERVMRCRVRAEVKRAAQEYQAPRDGDPLLAALWREHPAIVSHLIARQEQKREAV